MKIIILLICLFLPGCASVPSKILIPIQKPCLPVKLPPQPHLAIEKLKTGTPLNQVVKAYVISVKQLQDNQKVIYTLVGSNDGKTG